jgi:hypothetical protein
MCCVCYVLCVLCAVCCVLWLQFTSEHYILEGAREVLAAGADSYKFNLANLDARGNPISVSSLHCSALHQQYTAPTLY